MSGFATTRWSLVLAARDDGAAASDALGELIRRYRAPVLAYIRASGRGGSEAEDLTQGFFLSLLEKRYDRRADPSRGRFRSFLLTALKAWLANAADAAASVKRGGRISHGPLDDSAVQSALVARGSPEHAFEREFALVVLHSALAHLRSEADAAGRAVQFDALVSYVLEAPEPDDYRRAAAALGISGNHVAVQVKRWRTRLAELARRELAATLADPRDVDAELDALRSALLS
jgi:RNA polymerase sigma-70 factor (ECF subfamily)